MKTLTVSADRLSLLEDGTPWVHRGTLDWAAYARLVHEGDDAFRALLIDRRSVGANTVCCAGMSTWFNLYPATTPGYWEKLRTAAEIAERESMRLCFVVFTTTEAIMPDLGSQQAHWERFYTTLGDKPNVSLVLVNQAGYPDQHSFDPLAFDRTQPVAGFPPLLCSRGNPGESANPTIPAWDIADYCSSRDPVKGVYEVGSSMHYVVHGWAPGTGWDGAHVAARLFEGPHFRPTGEWADPGKARELARSLCFKGTIGGNFYSDQCAQAAILTGVERMCAVEFLGNLPGV